MVGKEVNSAMGREPAWTGNGMSVTARKAGMAVAMRTSMPRDPHRLETFRLADTLVLRVYPLTASLPAEERYGLQTQIRRAAISVPTNIVEGSQRSGRRDYMRFVEVAAGSAAEAGYLVGLARRLGYLDASQAFAIETDYAHLVRGLERLRQAIGRPSDLRPAT